MRIKVLNNIASLKVTSSEITLNGPLTLSGPSTLPLHGVTKQYVDDSTNAIDASNITSGILSINRLPAFSGDATSTSGSNVFNLVDANIPPGTYVKPEVDAKGRIIGAGTLVDSDIPNISFGKITVDKPTTLNGYGITDGVDLSGDTITGELILNNNPTNNLDAVTKEYVDNIVSLGAIAVGDIVRKPTNITPPGFLRCNGAILDKTTYANLYAVIGDTFGSYVIPGSGKPWKQQYQINDTQDGNITGWTTSTSLPGPLAGSQAIVTKNRVYLLGGYDGINYFSTVYTAPINSDGTLGAWVTNTNSLPGPICWPKAIVTKNRVYLLGGRNGSNYLSTVYTAPINSDGTLGAWVTNTNSLPGPLGRSQAIVTKNRVYLLGGYNGSSYVSTVYTAPINSDGTLGTWTTGTSLPGLLEFLQAIVTKNRVYLLGGYNSSSTAVSTVYTAPINSDGTLGAWTTGTSLPGPLSHSQAIVTKNRVYLLGGWNNGILSTVYTAPINSDGTLGTWTTGTSLPGIFGDSQAIVTKNRVYLLGGWNNSGIVSTVYTAPISGGLNDYSPYYDGSISPLDTSTSFMLPDYSTDDAELSPDIYSYIKY